MSRFQETFIRWLGPEPEKAILLLHHATGYSLDYLRWAGGMAGQKPWPGSRRFVHRMRQLGCTTRCWKDRTPEQIAQAFASREVWCEGQEVTA